MSNTTEKTLQYFKDEAAVDHSRHTVSSLDEFRITYVQSEVYEVLNEAADRYARHMAAKAWEEGCKAQTEAILGAVAVAYEDVDESNSMVIYRAISTEPLASNPYE